MRDYYKNGTKRVLMAQVSQWVIIGVISTAKQFFWDYLDTGKQE